MEHQPSHLNDRSAALGEVIEFKGRVYYIALKESIDPRRSVCERASVCVKREQNLTIHVAYEMYQETNKTSYT